MTEVKIISKKDSTVLSTVKIAQDETIVSLLYWVHMALSIHKKTFAQFSYSGSTYIVSVDE